MFFRIVSDSFARKPRRKVLTAAALALGMAVATATLEVALDVGDRLAHEFRSLGANLLVTPATDTLPLEIGGVDYRPVDAGAYLPEGDLGKLKTIFWRNNIVGFAPFLDVPVEIARQAARPRETSRETLIGTWYSHTVDVPDGSKFVTGFRRPIPGGISSGRWFSDGAEEVRARRRACPTRGPASRQARSRSARGTARARLPSPASSRQAAAKTTRFSRHCKLRRTSRAARPVSPPAGERVDQAG